MKILKFIQCIMKPVVMERLIRTLKTKIYEYMTPVSKTRSLISFLNLQYYL